MICDSCREQVTSWNVPALDEDAMMMEQGVDAPDHDCGDREKCLCGGHESSTQLPHNVPSLEELHRYDSIEGVYPPKNER